MNLQRQNCAKIGSPPIRPPACVRRPPPPLARLRCSPASAARPPARPPPLPARDRLRHPPASVVRLRPPPAPRSIVAIAKRRSVILFVAAPEGGHREASPTSRSVLLLRCFLRIVATSAGGLVVFYRVRVHSAAPSRPLPSTFSPLNAKMHRVTHEFRFELGCIEPACPKLHPADA